MCTDFVYCGKGKYNDGQNNCLACASHVKACNAVTGYANTCTDTTFEIKNVTGFNSTWNIAPAFQATSFGQC